MLLIPTNISLFPFHIRTTRRSYGRCWTSLSRASFPTWKSFRSGSGTSPAPSRCVYIILARVFMHTYIRSIIKRTCASCCFFSLADLCLQSDAIFVVISLLQLVFFFCFTPFLTLLTRIRCELCSAGWSLTCCGEWKKTWPPTFLPKKRCVWGCSAKHLRPLSCWVSFFFSFLARGYTCLFHAFFLQSNKCTQLQRTYMCAYTTDHHRCGVNYFAETVLPRHFWPQPSFSVQEQQ